MDRVFNEATPSLKAVEIQLKPAPEPEISPVPESSPTKSPIIPPWQQFALIGMTLGALLSSAWVTRNWQLSQQALQRERNLALIEKLKPSTSPPTSESPKPDQPESVATLPVSTLPTLEPLTIPLSPAIAPAPAISATSGTLSSNSDAAPIASAPIRQPALVGVVHAEVGGSAIFQLDNQSLSATPGESIGNSGWSLLSISSTGAVIERNGTRQSLSVGGVF
jgi:hypothetical protein